jgi:hypothetical protein
LTGAAGDLLHDLMRVNPERPAVVFDLPHVIPDAAAAAVRNQLTDRGAGDRFPRCASSRRSLRQRRPNVDTAPVDCGKTSGPSASSR